MFECSFERIQGTGYMFTSSDHPNVLVFHFGQNVIRNFVPGVTLTMSSYYTLQVLARIVKFEIEILFTQTK